MATTLARPGHRRAKGLIALMGLVAFLGMCLALTAQAQEQEKKAQPEQVKPAQGEAKAGKDKDGKDKDGKADDARRRLRNVVRLGYTRPSNVDDKVKGDKVIPVAFTDHKGKIIAGTVYFTVLERADRVRDRDRDRDADGDRDGLDPGDTWGTGLSSFDSHFVAGRNFEGGVSPRLDTRARYIYLYQLVNDPGLDPHEIKPASYDSVRAEDVSSFALKLLVDPRYITSWGHFQGSGFNAVVPDRNLNNKIRLAANGEEKKVRLAISSNPSILAELPNRAHRYRSPAYALGRMAKSFDVGQGNLNLADSYDHEYLANQRGVIQAAFVEQQLKLDDRLREPNFVQIQYFTGGEQLALGEGNVDNRDDAENRGTATGMFRVDWRAGQFVKLGQHSVVFGFTSDLGPVDEPIVIADPEEALRSRRMIRELLGGDSGEQLKQAVGAAGGAAEGNEAPGGQQFVSFVNPGSALRNALLGQGQGTAPGVAPGTAPTPAGGAGGATPGAAGGAAGSMGGSPGGGGGGFGFPSGGLGAARSPAFAGGGGFGGGKSNGNGGQTQQGQQGQQGQQAINITNTLANQQSQQQQQGQFQLQGQLQAQAQNNRNNHHHHHNVVPAPASVLLGLLGLPGLFLLRRRTQKQAA
jgi:hypothetical protein